jgi:SAM-dependent methyltransferase
VTHPLPLTGERTLPGVRGEEYWFARHEAAYRGIAATYADELRDAVVVDAGSGEGYGAAILRGAGVRLVVALEHDEAASHHAGSAYADVATARADLAALPLSPGSADVVVSLQVVEHLWDLPGFLRGCRAALRPGGLVVVSTPNRPVFSPGLGRGERPTNPFHVEELDAVQLADRLDAAGFAEVDVRGLHHGPRLAPWERETGGGLVAAQVSAAVEGGPLPDGLDAAVAAVTAEDFVVGGPDGAQDLLALARRP